jgi:lipopolysaccharide/colanic/teichoic acid biosynthesis glycosyltransferase
VKAGWCENAQALKPQLAHLNERKDGPLFKIKNDPRVTRVGRVLRKFRLDEVPQLLNVLKGELALVGPRPRELQEAEQYPADYKVIINSRNGVTGFSQVNGASSLPFMKELELDKYYVEHLSFWLDLRIFLKTIAILFFDPTAV